MMRQDGLWTGLVVMSLVCMSCAQHVAPSVIPPMPQELARQQDEATWSRPERIQIPDEDPPPVPEGPRPAGPNEQVVPFEAGTEYLADVAPGWPLKIVLEPGEHFTGLVGGARPLLQEGEQPPWEIKQSVDGAVQQYVFVTVTTPGLSMGLVITTDKRSYDVTVKSVRQTKIRALRWTYTPTHLVPIKKTPPGGLPENGTPYQLNVGYLIQAATQPPPPWFPVWAGDDGKRTYILFPSTMVFADAPLVRVIGVQGPEPVNGRQIHNVMILDRLIDQAEVRLGVKEHAAIVTVTRGNGTIITCPGASGCPLFPVVR